MNPEQNRSVTQATESRAAAAAAALADDNRRQHERYEVVKPLLLIPVLSDGSLDWSRRSAGFSCNVSEGGLGLEVDQPAERLPRSLLVGVEDESGDTYFAGVNVRYSKQGDSSGTYVGASFGGPAEQILDEPSLRPKFNAQTLSIEYPVPKELLQRWMETGVLTRALCDRIQVCPRCRALPTVREACRKCSSARVRRDQLIHHFACAHVDQAIAFQESDELTCPKCKTKKLVAGADFEYLHGQYWCEDCNWQDTSLESIGHCLRCDHRFAIDSAQVENVYVYRANKLNWRNLIDAPQQQIGRAEATTGAPIEPSEPEVGGR